MVHPIYVRPDRARVLWFGSVGIAGGAFALYRLMSSPSPDIEDVLSLMLVLVAAIGAVFNYLFFHYVAIGTEKIRQVQYLGLVKREIERIKSVEAGRVRPTIFTFDTIRLCGPDGVIEFIPEMYQRRSVVEALNQLRDVDVPVDQYLVRKFKLQSDPDPKK